MSVKADMGWKRFAICLALIALTAVLITLASAPFDQFYLGWICLVPWLIAVTRTSSPRRAFGLAWIGGVLAFAIHGVSILWLTIPGGLALCAALAVTWAIAGWAARLLLHEPPRDWKAALARSIGFALVWTACEWLRGRLLLDYPIFLLGHTQAPFSAITQMADLAGAYGVTLLVAGVNAAVAQMALLSSPIKRRVAIVSPWLAGLIIAIGYGVMRLSQETQSAGPRVMVVQSNNPFRRGGEPGIDQKTHFDLLLKLTHDGLNAVRGNSEPPVDLVVWPESITPPINSEAREELAHFEAGPLLAETFLALSRLARNEQVSLIVGGYSVSNWQLLAGKRTGTDIRNSAYLFNRAGDLAGRYDKLHLVPFGEYVPFKLSLLQWLAPRPLDVPLRPGELASSQLTLAGSKPFQMLPLICLEDNLAEQLRKRVRASERKPDLIVSLNNDGWFRSEFMAQRLAAARFLCIEMRMPMARSENGGISAFIDSNGQLSGEVPAWSNGARAHQMMLDARTTLYEKTGDILPPVGLVVLIVLLGRRWIIRLPRASDANDAEAIMRP